jgi:hypothetical protein
MVNSVLILFFRVFGCARKSDSHHSGRELSERAGPEFFKPQEIRVRGLSGCREVFFGKKVSVPDAACGEFAADLDFQQGQFRLDFSFHFIF